MNTRHIFTPAAVLALALLGGCASVREVHSTVRSYSSLSTVPVPPLYRLELLPSQRAAPTRFAPIEALAQQALERVGLQRDDAAASLVVHIGVDAQHLRDPRRAWGAWSYGRAWPHGAWGWNGWGYACCDLYDHPVPEHSVSVVMRDAATQAIVYETSATRQDTWSDDPAIFGPLFDAALTGFPQPPAGQRQVRTALPDTP